MRAGPVPMRWLELSVEVDVEAVEAVSEILGRATSGTAVRPTRLLQDPDDELSARPDLDAPFVVTAHLALGSDNAAVVDETERALWHLQAFGLGPVGQLRVREVNDDWAETWKAHYVPQRIGRLVVIPSWVGDEPIEPTDVPIVMDPGMAFGTGLHPTTRGCLELLQVVSPMPGRVLDVGIGSGILAIAALGLGAGTAHGLDIDPLAIDATRANAERNGVGARLTAEIGTLPQEQAERYGLILANLVAAVLVEIAPRLAAHLAPDGVILASGVIAPRADEVIGAMRAAGLRVADRRDDEDWVSLRLEPVS